MQPRRRRRPQRPPPRSSRMQPRLRIRPQRPPPRLRSLPPRMRSLSRRRQLRRPRRTLRSNSSKLSQPLSCRQTASLMKARVPTKKPRRRWRSSPTMVRITFSSGRRMTSMIQRRTSRLVCGIPCCRLSRIANLKSKTK